MKNIKKHCWLFLFWTLILPRSYGQNISEIHLNSNNSFVVESGSISANGNNQIEHEPDSNTITIHMNEQRKAAFVLFHQTMLDLSWEGEFIRRIPADGVDSQWFFLLGRANTKKSPKW